MAATTYSFLNCVASISGVGGVVNFGAGAAVAEEGISIEMMEDKDTMIWGADGVLMHALHAAKPGRITVRLLKTSPTNAKLSSMYNSQSASSANWGGNTITVSDNVRGDTITGTSMAFMRFPTIVYSKEGAMQEWSWGGIVDQVLGDGAPVSA
jgi:hypothetical protein